MTDIEISIKIDVEDLLDQLCMSEKKLLFQTLFNDSDLTIDVLNNLISDTDYKIEEI